MWGLSPMRSPFPLGHLPRVQFRVELDHDEEGRISGEVVAGGAPAMPFSGWLELLRLLEDAVEAHSGDALDQLGYGRDGQEKA